jgi:hypothetical protein
MQVMYFLAALGGREHAMDYKDVTEQALRALVRDAEARAQKAYNELAFLKGTLDTYLTQFGQQATTQEERRAEIQVESGLAERLKQATYREMLRLWADTHDGQIIAKEIVSAAFSTGRFDTRTKAHRTMWSALSQAAKRGEYEHIGKGMYRTKGPSPVPLLDHQEDEAT